MNDSNELVGSNDESGTGWAPDEDAARIAERAYAIWEEEGRPDGRDREHWERARFLVGIERNPAAGTLPNPAVATVQNPRAEPVERGEELREAVENLGEFPGLADQGEDAQAPLARRARAGGRKGD
jgi:hypothetical protein